MRIWLITVGEPLPVDGPDVRLYRTGILANLLVSRGHRVTWWSSAFDHTEKRQRSSGDTAIDLSENLRLILLHSVAYATNVSLSRIANHIGIARAFRRLAPQEPKPDLILASLPTLELALAAVKYGEQYQVPVVVDVRDLWPDIFVDLFPRPLQALARVILYPYTVIARRACRGAAAIIGITPAIVGWGLRYAGRPGTSRDKAFPLGYSSSEPSAEAVFKAGQFWRNHGIDEKTGFIVCFFGAMGRQFDLDTVIEAAKTVENTGADIRFVLCGKGDSHEHYKQLAASCSNVVFPGWVGASEIWTLMRMAKIGLAPYNSTPDFEMSIPNKVIEYFSAGLPIISSLQGVVANILLQYNCGMTYSRKNSVELANSIMYLHDNPEVLSEMSQNAGGLFKEKFIAENVYGELVSHLEDIANNYRGVKND